MKGLVDDRTVSADHKTWLLRFFFVFDVKQGLPSELRGVLDV
jgi:hypothetical protein